MEIRICDIPMRVDETIALAALAQATAVKLHRLHERNQSWRQYGRALIMENKWRASRYGLDGMLIDFGREEEVPERALILEYLDFVDDVLDELDSRAEIEVIRRILDEGTGADRQLRAYAESGNDIKAVVRCMIEETKEGLA
jgi:carboxylate-amine ligase